MNRYAYLPLALLTTACADQITTPTPEQSTPQQPPVVATAQDEPTAPWMTLTGPPPGCSPASEPVQWTVAINNAPELTRLYAHAFRSPKAGCANTVEELALMTVDGPLHYATGASGTTRFLFEARRAQCGRTEVGVIWKKASGEDVMLSWQVVDSGKDCAPPPTCATDPKLCPPPPICPVITATTWRNHVTAASVVADTASTAVSNFTVNLPVGCTIPLSVVSYQIRTCGVKFPQRFVDGSEPAGKAYGPGIYTGQMRVQKTAARYQVDLRFEGFVWGHELTQEVENSYYKVRTIAWLLGSGCV